MKNIYIVSPSVFRFSKTHSEAWVFGYVYGLLDWGVISQETFDRLVLSVETFFHNKKLSSYDNKGDQLNP